MGTVVFLLTVALVLAGLVYALVALVRGRRRKALRALGLVVAWVALYALVLVTVSLVSRPKVLSMGQERCFDEMCFSVVDAASTPTLHEHQARGIYYVAVIRLHNTARRQPQRPSSLRIWLRDGNGHEYRQPVLADPPGAGEPCNPALLFPTPLPPQKNDVVAIAFDVPDGIPDPQLVIQEGPPIPTAFIIGDENSFLHAKTGYTLKARQ